MIAETKALGRVYGYIRVSTDKQALSPETQRHTIEETARRHGLSIDAWFQDAPVQNQDGSWNDAQSGKVPLPERKAGKVLCERLKRGDVVIVAKVDRAFRKLSDCVIMLDRWERLGVSLVLCDFPMLSDLSNPFGKAMVQLVAVFAEIERKLISQRTREALALRKRKGHAHSRFPGYGFKWERRGHTKVKVTDLEERRIMAEIAKWRIDGHAWDQIAAHLTAQGILTKDGTPWSQWRVRRACLAELRLQAEESRNTAK
jgi:DNA invertase Pin-like site-specific DNA recombinase